jgi:hypothetical protein
VFRSNGFITHAGGIQALLKKTAIARLIIGANYREQDKEAFERACIEVFSIST